jgi:hypothetical protein
VNCKVTFALESGDDVADEQQSRSRKGATAKRRR